MEELDLFFLCFASSLLSAFAELLVEAVVMEIVVFVIPFPWLLGLGPMMGVSGR